MFFQSMYGQPGGFNGDCYISVTEVAVYDLLHGNAVAATRRVGAVVVDSAADLTACDLVVTVSNTTAHLAGALGKPTLLFVPQSRGQLWYWFNDRNDSPWYPSMRVERQKLGQSWKDLIARSADQAAALLKQARTGQPG